MPKEKNLFLIVWWTVPLSATAPYVCLCTVMITDSLPTGILSVNHLTKETKHTIHKVQDESDW